MDTSSGIIQIFGFILVLSGATLILVRIVSALSRGNKRRVRLAVEILLGLSVIYWFAHPALSFVGMESAVEQTSKAVAFLWVISAAFLINALTNLILWSGMLSHQGVRHVPKLITDGIGLIVYALAVMLVLHYVYDEPIGAILATSGAAAVVIGFGAQSTIREVFSGLALNATKALRIGDFVEIDGIYGEVYDINWRSVSLKNPHTDSLYIFPNSAAAERTILNFSEPTDRFRYYVTFSVELSAPPAKVIQVIAEELESSRYVFRDPKPDFNLLGYSEKGIDYRVRYHFDGDDPWWDAQNEIIMAIWSAMRKQGFRLSMNRMLQDASDEWPAIDERVSEKTQFSDVEAAVKNHSVLGVLHDESIAALCKSYQTIDLGPPSNFYRSGTQSNGIYLLLEGEVSVFETLDSGTDVKIDNCLPGELFGVGAAMSGSTHRFTAHASEYSIAVCFPLENFEKLLPNNSDLIGTLKKLVAKQNTGREITREAERKSTLLAQHQKQRHTVKEELRSSVEELLQKPALHHLLDHLFKSVRNEELAEGMMAGAAIIVAARGIPDGAEKEYLLAALHGSGMVGHLDIDHSMALFAKYTDLMMEEQDAATKQVFRALTETKRVKNGPHIVLKICTGLCGVHALPTKAELVALEQIEKTLDVKPRSH